MIFFYSTSMMALYLVYSVPTFLNRNNNPIIFGNTRASIIASENLITASRVTTAPKTVNTKKNRRRIVNNHQQIPTLLRSQAGRYGEIACMHALPALATRPSTRGAP